MGKITRRGSVAATAALAATLAFGTAAAADVVTDPGPGGPDSADSTRFADRDRIGTAIKAYQDPGADWGNTAIVAYHMDYADALAAAPLADAYNAPIFVNPTNALDARVADVLDDFDNVIIVGGEGVISAGVEASIDAIVPNVYRLGGAHRYATAILIAEHLRYLDRDAFDGAELDAEYEWNDEIFLTTGLDFADALAAGAAAGEAGGAVLLTGNGGLDRTTFDYLTFTYNTGKITTVGGPADRAARAGYEGVGITVDQSYVGDDRYETATLLAEGEFDIDGPTDVNVAGDIFTVASGLTFADAVVAGGYAANADGPLLLTFPHTELSQPTADYLTDYLGEGDEVVVFGGPAAVGLDVQAQIDEIALRNF